MGIAEIYRDVGRQRESFVVRHFLAPIPCQGFVEFLRQLSGIFDQGVGDCRGIFPRQLDQHQIARLAFYQCRYLTILAATEEIAFPMSRHGSILHRSRACIDPAEPAQLIWLKHTLGPALPHQRFLAF